MQQRGVQHLVGQHGILLGGGERVEEARVDKDCAPVGGGGWDLEAHLEARIQRQRGEKRATRVQAQQPRADHPGGAWVEFH